MQDRFKFRGYHPVIGEVMDISEIDFRERIAYFTDGDSFNIDEIKLMQSTGLKDKNGELIYEGDILFEDWKNQAYPKGKYWIVKWNKNQANFYIEMINPSKFENRSEWHLARHDLDYEIIGNIYENPEQLEEKQCN